MRTFKNLKEISKKAVATFLQPYCCILLAKYSLAKNPGVLEKKNWNSRNLEKNLEFQT